MSSRSKQTSQPAPAPTRSSSRLKLPGTRTSAAAEPAAATARTRSSTRNTTGSTSQDAPQPAQKTSKFVKSITTSVSKRVPTSKDGPIQTTPSATVTDTDSLPMPTSTDGAKPKLPISQDIEREAIKAFLRIRPSPSETSDYSPYLTVLTDQSVLLTDPSASQNQASLRRLTSSAPPSSSVYTFTHIFPPETSQSDFFKEAALPLVQDLLNGENGLIFAYGVTNSGKTYTVQGGKEPGQAGLLPRTVDAVFSSIQDKLSNAPLKPLRLSSVEYDPNSSTTNLASIELPTGDEVLSELLPSPPTPSDANADDIRLEVYDRYEYAVWVSYIEIYNEKIYDLLGACEEDAQPAPTRPNPLQRKPSASSQGTMSRSKTFTSILGNKISTMVSSFSLTHQLTSALTSSSSSTPVVTRKALSLKTDSTSPRNGKYVFGLKEIRVANAEEARKVIQMGQINRRVFGTLANKQSSRSHAVFSLRVIRVAKGADIQKDPSAVHTSRLSFVDLAGSERNKNTQTAGDRLKEAGNINKSLMVLGQCLEVMRNNQKRAARASSYGENIASRPDNKSTIVPFWYSKLTELFQDYFEGDGKAVMVVNVNPYDTGFDENSHVMKFAALAREVTTNVTQTKAPAGVVVAPPPPPKPSAKLPPARRTVSIVVEPKDGPSKETLWEVAEEEEDEPEEKGDDLVDQLFDIIEELKTKLYESELRFAMAEVEVREEVTREFEERIQDMEANFAKRRAADEEENDAKMDRKIDLLYKAGLLGQRGGPKDADFEDEEDIDASLAVDEEEDELEDDDELESSPTRSRRKEQPLPSERVSDVSLGSVVTEGSTAASGSEHEESFELEDDEDGSNSDGTATDGEWAPKSKKAGKRIESGPQSGYSDNDYAKKGSSKHPKQQSSKAGKGKAKESDVLKTSNNAKSSGGKKAPRVVPLPSYDLSVVQTPMVRNNAQEESNGSMDESDQDAQVVGDSEEEVLEPVVTKKKKRILGGKAPVTEDQILEVTQRVEQPSRGSKKTADVRRMVSS